MSEPHIRKVRPDELEEVRRVRGYLRPVEQARVRGMVSALVRGRVWYVSMLFVLLGRALAYCAVVAGTRTP